MRYENLSDVEFEYLCRDVMSRKLGRNLESFTQGRDGGIDLTDSANNSKIVVQVKHYVKTGAKGLINALRKEISKVKELNPEQYYICCSIGLTPNNKNEIYKMFSSYMESTIHNIITSIELDSFLEEQSNVDILRKHFKLWIDSTNILLNSLNNDIFLDSDTFLSNIMEEERYFVRTNAFDEAIKCLSERNVLLIIGNPGVGKTITSKMLILSYAANGFRVRYTTDISNINALKKSLVQTSDVKEIILLDDCFGQAYFNMKDTQETELLALIKYINLNTNKILIMNSRVSIYNEAYNRTPDLVKSFNLSDYRTYVINMENISLLDKAKIFYNHLYFNEIPGQYFEKIKDNDNYKEIIKHRNYNPRIIEFVCLPSIRDKIKPEEYMSFINESLDNREKVWENEYNHRLEEVDRIFLVILYSLTDTFISFELFGKCFEKIISNKPSIDNSVNQLNQSLKRLTNSMVKIIDNSGIKMIGATNPSVNDFLANELKRNNLLKATIIENSHSVRQLKRLMINDDYNIRISKLFEDRKILSFTFENESQKEGFIAVWCILNNVYDLHYSDYITKYVFNIRPVDMYEKDIVNPSELLDKLLSKDFAIFYKIDKLFTENKLESIVGTQELKDMINIINRIDWMFSGQERKNYIKNIQNLLKESIADFCYMVPAWGYDSDVAISLSMWEDKDIVIMEIENEIKNKVLDDLNDMLKTLPEDIDREYFGISSDKIYIDEIESTFFGSNYNWDTMREESKNDAYLEELEIENIFKR